MSKIELNLSGIKSIETINEGETARSFLNKLEKEKKVELNDAAILLNGKRVMDAELNVRLKDGDALLVLASGFMMGG